MRKANLDRARSAAHKCLKDLWLNATGSGTASLSPLDFLIRAPDACVAAMGYHLEQPYSIPPDTTLRPQEIAVQTAGTINLVERVIHVAKKFPFEMRRFTLAHELGHANLHSGAMVYHRDRPLGGGERVSERRRPEEIEADVFAAEFLLPARTVTTEFRARFGSLIDGRQLDSHLAWLVSKGIGDEINPQSWVARGQRGRSHVVAGLTSFGNIDFPSLASAFRVSRTAMGIRLEELGLVF